MDVLMIVGKQADALVTQELYEKFVLPAMNKSCFVQVLSKHNRPKGLSRYMESLCSAKSEACDLLVLPDAAKREVDLVGELIEDGTLSHMAVKVVRVKDHGLHTEHFFTPEGVLDDSWEFGCLDE